MSMGVKVDMIDASVMRNVGSPGSLLAATRLGGVPDGKIRVQPLMPKMCVLVMVTGEGSFERALDKVVSRRGRSRSIPYSVCTALPREIFNEQSFHSRERAEAEKWRR